MTNNICGIMIGETTTEEKAQKLTNAMKNCPYLYFGGFSSKTFHYVFIVPEEKKWWLEYPASHPNIIGAEKVKLKLVENIVQPDKFEIVIPKEKSKTSPCGSSCENCPMRSENHCTGCPATIYYEVRI
ncbi:MAG: hypothetical protein ACFFAE_13985 [Candidatus Hodarchaeota archaeon]